MAGWDKWPDGTTRATSGDKSEVFVGLRHCKCSDRECRDRGTYREDIVEGLENTPKAFIRMLNGENKRKQLVKVA